MNDWIDWEKVGGKILVAPAGSLDFKEISTTPVKTNCVSKEEPKWCNDPLTVEVEVKWSDKDRRRFRRLFARKRVPRKTKKAIKKQCPGITPSEIQNLLWAAKFRRIKHRRK